MLSIKPGYFSSLIYPHYRHTKLAKRLQSECLKLKTDPNYNRLVCQVPVRFGKSFWCDFLFPTFLLFDDPNTRIILATHTHSFSSEWVAKCRDAVAEYGPAFGIQLDPSYQSRDHFKIKGTQGEMRAVGVNGSCAGFGGNWLIFDDLISDQFEAASPVMRYKMETWFNAEFLTRGEPGSKVLGIMSARHPADIINYLLKQNPELPDKYKWHNIKIPAINEQNESLDPERYPIEKLNQIRDELTKTGQKWIFDALYQQEPIDISGVEWPEDYMPNFYDHTPDERIRFRLMALDPSVGRADKSGDFPALIYVLIQSDGHVFIEDASMTIAPIDQIEDLAVMWLNKYKPDAFIIETNGFQELVSANIQRKCPEAPIYKHDSRENKEVRIRMGLTPILAQHRLHLKNIPANKIIWQQLREFPSGLHDDGPDVINLACDLCNKLCDTHK